MYQNLPKSAENLPDITNKLTLTLNPKPLNLNRIKPKI